MLRFFSRFQADFQLKSGWIEPRLVGGYAPFSPYEKVAPVTDLVIEYLQFVMKAGTFRPRTTSETEKGGNT